MPKSVNSFGGKLWYTDNRETADTLMATYDYGDFVANYEHRSGNGNSMFGKSYGTMFHGSKATLFVDRSLYRVYPEKGSSLEAMDALIIAAGYGSRLREISDSKPLAPVVTSNAS